jgi:hypothetical protein
MSRVRILSIRLVILPLAIAALPAYVAAQDYRPERPYRGLFGADGSTTGGTQFDIQWAVASAYDANVLADSETNSDPRLQVAGRWQLAEASAKYRVKGSHASFQAAGFGKGRYYPSLDQLSTLEGGGTVRFDAELGQRTKISASQGARKQPYYQINFVPNLGSSELSVVSSADDALTARKSHTFDGRFGFSEKVGGASVLAIDYDYRYTQIAGASDPFRWQLINGTFTSPLTKYSALRVGYGYGQSQWTFVKDSQSIASHNIDLGVAYARPLSQSRRTAFGFSPGSTVLADHGSTYYRVLVVANVAREIGRTWLADLGYHRGVSFIEGFAGPTYADSVHLRIGGLISKRIDVRATSAYSNGEIGLTRNGGDYITYSGVGDVRIALNRRFSFVTRYEYYQHEFDQRIAVPFGIGNSVHRQSIRFGVSGWLPIVQ